eukprot:gnl/MRDRNA2_/MRDRNA2_113666_c0_seq1.p1 gnl/MRDRNA2_/MRDRNA2_113666_c0~~gnl/MRDRNA2_/MRDRNA2_113666_c0_seq1.p1  ORF type:complete len:511 (+),score=104.94 gnl/MRDRNA2_/MRDRNA2_113666_c0_seq1:43-1533(+)
MAASSKDRPITASESLFITVQYDDTEDQGLLVEVSEDDQCDPRFWRFQEIHDSSSKWKILFDDGEVMFLGECPRNADGIFVDQDGDSHRYILEAAKTEAVNPSNVPAPVRSNSSLQKPSQQTATYVSQVVDSGSVATSGSKTASEDTCGLPTRGEAKQEFNPKGTSACISPKKATTASVVDQEPGLKDTSTCNSPTKASTASTVDEDHIESQKEPAESAPLTDDASKGNVVSRKSMVLIELAKTARSICRTCSQGIPREGLRCGLEAYRGGHSVVLWSHGSCFLKSILVDYSSARRGKCRGSGQEFQQGDVRVRLEVGEHSTWWLPAEAAKWTQQVIAKSEGQLETVQGLENLDVDHREVLLNLLKTGQNPTCALRKASSQKPSARAGRTSRSSQVHESPKRSLANRPKDANGVDPDTAPTPTSSMRTAKRRRVISEDSDSDLEIKTTSVGVVHEQEENARASIAAPDPGCTGAELSKEVPDVKDDDSDLEVVATQ